MLKVTEILPDGKAVVDTAGLYRIVMQPSGKVLDEFCTDFEAESFIEGFNNVGGDGELTAVAVPYVPVNSESEVAS